ncbi:MAG TPA: thiamine phosphate synthase [Bacteroidia bacterium]
MSFEIIVITPEVDSPKETDVICRLFEMGLQVLHLRKPNTIIDKLRKYIQRIPKQFHKRIILHSHYDLIKEFNLKGAHLTEKVRESVKEINTLKRKKTKTISTSFHSTKEILNNNINYEYVFLSPVFDSISKQGYKSNFTSDELTLFLKKTKQRVIALGGIDDKNSKILKQLNFSGAAVLGFIWESKTPVENYKKLISKIK